MNRITIDMIPDVEIIQDDQISEEDIKHVNRIIYSESILSGKFHGSLEDPLSQLFYDISDVISPCLYGAGITPNFITTVRFLIMIVGFPYFFYHKMYHLAAMFYMIAYFFDCLDGHLSRKYNLDTEFGDYYDHIADATSFIITMYFIASTLHQDNKWIMILIMFLALLSLVQISCQERYLNIIGSDKDSYTLSIFDCLCPADDVEELEKTMEITKLFGIGIFQIFLTVLIWNFKHLE